MRLVRASLSALALLLLVFVLSGCDTTRDKSKRAQIFADRSLATRKPVVVKKKNPAIEVAQVQAVGKGKSTLLVVRLKNTSDDVLAALPINVSAKGKLLNRGPNIPYFANHVTAIAPKSTTVWIYRTKKSVSGNLTAVVGNGDPNLTAGKTLPKLVAQNVDVTDGGILGEVKNESGTPQYSVEIYVTTRSHGRYTSAALGRVVKLSSKGTRAFRVFPVGKPGKIEPKTVLGPAVLVDGPSN
jgi:hypothetical protein